jgi:hypothetical protein
MDDETTTRGIALPEDLSAVDDKGLAGYKTKILKAYERLQGKERLTADELAELGALVEQVKSVRAEEATREEAATAAEEQRKALAAEIEAATAVEEIAAEDETAEVVAEDATASAEKAGVVDSGTEAAAVAVEDNNEAVVAEEGETVETVEDAAEVSGTTEAGGREAAETVIQALAASLKGAGGVARPVPAARTRVLERSSAITIVASGSRNADDTYGRDELSIALHEKARTLNDAKGNTDRGAPVASLKFNTPKNDVSKILDDEGIRQAWDAAHDVESLVASGGWCAPSETIYDFVCDFEAMPEMLDLPSITSTRGGLRFPESPLLGDVLDDVDSGFTWTEADDIAAATPGGPTKPCFRIPCPDFDEVRLQAQGICVTAGNLTDRAYPELTNRYVDLVMTAHAHRMNGLTIAKVEAASTAVAPTVADLSAAEAVLASVELQIAASRDQFFMSEDQILEVVLPRWIRTVIRRDLARRSGVAYAQVSNADIAAFFGEIGARVQFVSNWQTLRAAGAFAGKVTLPATVKALVYPAGAHTRLDGGSIDLGVVRDSTLNATNDYTAAWTEEFWGVVSRCFSLVVTIALCADGSTGAPATIACPTA